MSGRKRTIQTAQQCPKDHFSSPRAIPVKSSTSSSIFIVSRESDEETATIGLFATFDEARMALREAANADDLADEVYEESYNGPESHRKDRTKELREGREGSEKFFDFDDWGKHSCTWTENWHEIGGTASIEILGPDDDKLMLSIERKEISKRIRRN